MKKTNLFLIAAICSICIFAGCSKDLDQLNQTENQVSENLFSNKSDTEITQMIKNFETDIIDKKKSGFSFNFDESVLLMEALFNYKYGHVGGSYINKFIDTVCIETEFSFEDDVSAFILFQYLSEINHSIYNAFTDCEYPQIRT